MLGMGHFEDELPGDVELADFGENVDEEVEGGGVVAVGGLGFGPREEGKGDLGTVGEAEEGLVDEAGGEGDAVELERGFHGVEGVVVLEEDSGDEVGVV